MTRSLIVAYALRDLIRRLPPDLKKKIRQGLEEIVKNPRSGKLLCEELAGLRSYKIGQIRIIYRTTAARIELVAIGPRKTIYEKVALEIKRAVRTLSGGRYTR